MLAGQALANMLAYGSGDCVRCSKARHHQSLRSKAQAAVANMQVHQAAGDRGAWPGRRIRSEAVASPACSLQQQVRHASCRPA